MRKIVALSVVLGYSVSVLGSEQQLRFGIADKMPDRLGCVTFQAPELSDGERVYVIDPDPPGWIRGHIVRKRSGPCDGGGMLEGIAYDVALDSPDQITREVTVSVVLEGEARLIVEDGQALLLTPGEASPISFQSCTSTEGLHFFAKRNGVPLWHEYYYLGYDVNPTCPEENLE